MQDITNITNEKDGDIIFVTVAKYKLFMSYGKIGMDAFTLYCHYMFTARLQETNQVYAKDVYLRQGLDWGKERIQKAKQLLIELELIKEITTRDEHGKFTGLYIRVVTKTTPFEIEAITYPQDDLPAAGKPASGKTETNALTKKNKCLNKKDKCFEKPDFQTVNKYITDKKYNVDSRMFFDFYNEADWIDSNGKQVRNWKQKVITWHNSNKKQQRISIEQSLKQNEELFNELS